MRRTLGVLAAVAAALAAPAGAGQLSDLSLVRECQFRHLCFDVVVRHGAQTAAAHNGRFVLWVSVTYVQGSREVATRTQEFPLERNAKDPLGVIRAAVVVPRKVSGTFEIAAQAAFGFTKAGVNRTGDRAFFVDETGVIRATDVAAPPCDDTDADPANDCPDALEN